MDTEDLRFEKQRQENVKSNVQAVSATCEASSASIHAFYQRKCESLDAILSSQMEARDQHIPKALLREFDEDQHLELALAPWNFQSMPGTRSTQWPDGLQEFVERLDQMLPISFWNEPLDTLSCGIEFQQGANQFLES